MKQFLQRIGFFGGLLLAAASACAPPQTVVNTAVPGLNAPVRGITVEGYGEAAGQPNIARVTVGVEARAATADAAIGDVNGRMASVINALKQAGVVGDDLRTQSIALHFERTLEPPPRPVDEAPPSKGKPGAVQPPAPPGPHAQPAGAYRASNLVEVTIRKLDHAGKIVSAATSAGANQVFGIQFEIEDPSSLAQEARKKAFVDAKTKAERLAELAGVPLGAPVSITEMGRGMPMSMQMMSMQREAADVPVERGELKIGTNVQVVFALGQ